MSSRIKDRGAVNRSFIQRENQIFSNLSEFYKKLMNFNDPDDKIRIVESAKLYIIL